MKVAVTGKGGVGKTTVAASLARCWRDLGYSVVAVDADPDANLAGTLGYRGPAITPLVKLKALIEERVGGGEGWGGFLRMNPRVDDIPGRVRRGGGWRARAGRWEPSSAAGAAARVPRTSCCAKC